MKLLEAQIKQQKATAGGGNPPAPVENADPAKSPGKINKPGRSFRRVGLWPLLVNHQPNLANPKSRLISIRQPNKLSTNRYSGFGFPRGWSLYRSLRRSILGVQNPAANGQWQNSFDARRVVLLPTYTITDNIIFNAEIEFEHAGAGFDNDDKLHGTAEIEQVWVDFKFSDPVSWRAPGVDLVPIGYINQHHEPTQFYSVLRPELYNGLIPIDLEGAGNQPLRHDRRRYKVSGHG